MKFIISKPSGPIKEKIILPSSKSISNRLLIIDALSGGKADLSNLSDSDDTLLMKKALQSGSNIKDIGHAGTAMRFLTAFYASGKEEVILTGSDRMKQRPVGALVEALLQLGADIEYVDVKGFPPLKIKGCKLKGGRLTIDGSVSSQFISALLMISPMMKDGLELELKGNIVSGSYIRMTLELMKQWGVQYSWIGNVIKLGEGEYKSERFSVESDWSASSYWYAIAALSDEADITLPFLFRNSLQGDSLVSELFDDLDINTAFSPDSITISKKREGAYAKLKRDFTVCPDLVQTLAVVLCAMGIEFHFTGTQTLRIKETDRISALQKELQKFGFLLQTNSEGSFLDWSGEMCEAQSDPEIETYHDHRMAMAFAPLALKFGTVTIKDPMVVTKSYPDFWKDLKRVGFNVEELPV